MTARDILGQANEQRESGNFLTSLQTCDTALIEFFKGNDTPGIAEALASRFLTLKHLAREYDDKNYLLIAKAEMLASVEIARNSNDKTALPIPLFNLAKVYEELNDLDNAISNYREALQSLEQNPPSSHNLSSKTKCTTSGKILPEEEVH